jgi:uncharacterized protein (UPF0335 family)
MRILFSVKDEETEIFFQEWHNVSKQDGFVNVVHIKEVCAVKKEDVDKQVYENAILDVTHRAAYNGCVDFIIKTTKL